MARDVVLASIRNAIPTRWSERVAELRSIGDVSLPKFLEQSGLELDDIYANNRSWSELRRAAGFQTLPHGPRARHRSFEPSAAFYILTMMNESIAIASSPPTQPTSTSPRSASVVGGFSACSSLRCLPMPRAQPLQASWARLRAHPQVCAELAELLDVLQHGSITSSQYRAWAFDVDTTGL